MSGDPDAADMAALQRGEAAALDRLMERWQGPLRGFLQRYVNNEHDAMDLAQESFVRVYLHRERFRPGSRFSTWMFQIALNLARDRARRQSRNPLTALEEAPEAADMENFHQSLESREKADAVREAVQALSPELREPVILFEYEGKSQAEIAEILDVTPKAVETRIYRAREQLRKRLQRWLKT